MKVYNKLVRDRIPEIIKNSGSECEYSMLTGEEKTEMLEKKLMEEAGEFLEVKNLEELADVVEVLFGLAEDLGYSEEELVRAREKKRGERGKFKEGIVLEKIF
ncbi:Predicted house-cleaning noncanonical NTP pyrophosphatase, all-alpha NTP-PPase (MazG) superfamily [Clostridium cavendishii DSM 21758]|uniref:Predicted house-cleaning noncanonical NTP pyrophosphatase, all-alpha NTP-PPase (MazG) superfamily n=1 Tax=Clostridium cavendishii DSM 21758 TaxID=1121302 RepID=A0A1M6GM38_9CLOT|nr:nucleoside triphosphate pyrophosphohydrolase [Clostridium cavendishii]SHJ10955.1 Predicted house-cleaning noncanonical NTP pyrophosphatase, all-alpha NTP-PPase (MazG) superfamily [Clostridium cavendishii DSM 21758]